MHSAALHFGWNDGKKVGEGRVGAYGSDDIFGR